MKVWAEPADRHRGFFAGMSLTIFALCHQFCLLCSISLYLFFSPCCFPPFSLAPCKCHIVSVAISLLSFPGLAARAAPAEESVVRMLASLCIHRRRTGSSSIARVITLGKKLADYSGPLSHCVLLCKILKERLVFANSSVSKSPRAVWVL